MRRGWVIGGVLAACVLAAGGGVQRAAAAAGSSYGAPTGAPIAAVAIDPTDPSIMSVTTENGDNPFNDEVWISRNGGTTWRRASHGSQVAFDPTVRGLAYVGDQLWLNVSTDDGRTLTSSLRAFGISYDRPGPVPYVTGTGLVYAVEDGGEIKQSTDRGKTWTDDPSLPGAQLFFNEVTGFAVSSSSNLAYAALQNGAFYRLNTDGPWQQGTSPGGAGCTPTALTVSPADESVVFASTSCGVFRTADGGNTWSAVTMADQSSGGGAVTVDPSNPSRVYMAGTDGVEVSNDGGVTFGAPVDVFQGQTTRQVAVDPANPSRVFAVTVAGLFVSTDAGQTWAPRNAGIRTKSFVLSTASNRLAPRIVYAGTRGGIWRSTDGGATWSYSEAGLLPDTIDIRSVTVDPENSATVYIQGSTGYYVSHDQGTSWSLILTGAGFVNSLASPVAVDPDADDHIAIAYGGGVEVSHDGGQTFVYDQFETDPSYGPQRVTQVAFDPANSAVIYAGAVHGLWRSEDDGATWSLLPGSEAGSANVLAIDPHRPSLIYYQAVYGHLEVSHNSGRTWEVQSINGRPIAVGTLTLDPSTVPSTAYGTIWTNYATMTASFDGGKSWVPGHAGSGTGDEPDTLSLAGNVRVRGVSGRERALYFGDESVTRGIFIPDIGWRHFGFRYFHTFHVSRGAIQVPVGCEDTWHAPCVGEIRLHAQAGLYATAFYAVPANGRRMVTLRLTGWLWRDFAVALTSPRSPTSSGSA